MPKIYTFESRARAGLFAFAGDADGSRLPEQLGPWRLTGTVPPNRKLAHRIDRGTVEKAIGEEGFQLWRMKS